MDLQLQGKRAVVTGATRGIGRAIAQALHGEGAEILAVARGSAGLAEIAAMPGVATVSADLTVEADSRALRAAVIDRWGGLDILVCNVGSGRSVLPGQETAAEWRRVLDVNLFTVIHTIEALRDLIEPGGSIVCISSIAGRRTLGAPVAYAAAKTALESLVANLARPLAVRRVRISAVAPGNILFPGSVWERKLAEDHTAVEAIIARDVPLSRLGTPEEIAAAVTFLASPRASFITGTVLVADGGQTGTT